MPSKYTVKSIRKDPDALIKKLKKQIGERWITPEDNNLRTETIRENKREDVAPGDHILIECEIKEIIPEPGYLHRLILEQREVRRVK